MSDQMREIFTKLGLPEPRPVPVLPVAHQVAQKLHACTGVTREGTNDRAHDLVDLQLLDQEAGIDLPDTAATARRLFAARKSHPWPPTVRAHPDWPQLYAEAAEGLGVRTNVDDAVTWTNDPDHQARRPTLTWSQPYRNRYGWDVAGAGPKRG